MKNRTKDKVRAVSILTTDAVISLTENLNFYFLQIIININSITMIAQVCEQCTTGLEAAARNGSLELLRWAHENGRPCQHQPSN